jgi:predicted nuclease of predicted toxin-antitoxin system
MKLLLDQNLSFKLAMRLSDLCQDVTHVRALGLEQAPDLEILAFAREWGAVIISMDRDFAELALFYGSPPAIVWLRCGNQPTAVIESKLRAAWDGIVGLEESEATVLEVY